MDMVGDSNKQINNAQLALQGGSDAEGGSNMAAQNHQPQHQLTQDTLDSGTGSSGAGDASGAGAGSGSGDGGKEFAGELQALPCAAAAATTTTTIGGATCTAVVPATGSSGLYSSGHSGPSAVVIAGGAACEDYDSDMELSRDESSAESRSSNICGTV